eukprot:g4581.t1
MPKQANHTFQGLSLRAGKGKKKGRASKTKMPMCQYGAGCRRKGCIYRHPPKPKKNSASTQPISLTGTVCTHFLAGYCAWGKGCRNIHPSDNVQVIRSPIPRPPGYYQESYGGDDVSYSNYPEYLQTHSRVAPAGFGGVGAGFGTVRVLQYQDNFNNNNYYNGQGEANESYGNIYCPRINSSFPVDVDDNDVPTSLKTIDEDKTDKPDSFALVEAILKDYTISEKERQERMRKAQSGTLDESLCSFYLSKSKQEVVTARNNCVKAPAVSNIASSIETVDRKIQEEIVAAAVNTSVQLIELASEFMGCDNCEKLAIVCVELLASPMLLIELGFRVTLDMFLPELATSTDVHPDLLRCIIHSTLLTVLQENGKNVVGSEECSNKLVGIITSEGPPNQPDIALLRYKLEQKREERMLRSLTEQSLSHDPPPPPSFSSSSPSSTVTVGMTENKNTLAKRLKELNISKGCNDVNAKGKMINELHTVAAPPQMQQQKVQEKHVPKLEVKMNIKKQVKKEANAWTKVGGKKRNGNGLDKRRLQPCHFFTQGNCTKGESCPYSHDIGNNRVVDTEDTTTWVASGTMSSRDYKMCGYRERAVQHHHEMEKCFAAAADAYRRQDGASAAKFAAEGRRHKKAMHESHKMASEEILKKRQESLPLSKRAFTLDLHGQHIKEGLEILSNRISAARISRQNNRLVVITGAGKHTELYGGRKSTATLRTEVAHWLRQNNIKFREVGEVLGTFHVNLYS